MFMVAPGTWKVPSTAMKIKAPAMDMGTDIKIMIGSRKLSNSAASDR